MTGLSKNLAQGIKEEVQGMDNGVVIKVLVNWKPI